MFVWFVRRCSATTADDGDDDDDVSTQTHTQIINKTSKNHVQKLDAKSKGNKRNKKEMRIKQLKRNKLKQGFSTKQNKRTNYLRGKRRRFLVLRR